jgi:alpha-L-fucosidase
VPEGKYMTGRTAVQLLVDIVAKGGNLLLNIAPGPLGQWHDDAYRMLDEMGEWMKVSSEAIYETRAMAPYKEGKVCISRKGDNTIFIYYMADDGESVPEQIAMSNFSLPAGSKVRMLGTDTYLKWKKEGSGFSVSLPEKLRKSPPSKYVWVLKATF